MLNLNIKMESR